MAAGREPVGGLRNLAWSPPPSEASTTISEPIPKKRCTKKPQPSLTACLETRASSFSQVPTCGTQTGTVRISTSFTFVQHLRSFLTIFVPFGKLHFIHALTNATDDHKYSLFPSQILTVPKFWCHLAHSFSRKKMSLLTLRGLFERLRAPSRSQKGHFSEKTKLKK